jgi:hypothetical protein
MADRPLVPTSWVVVAPSPKLTPVQRKRQGERRFKPIAIELGWIIYEWNRLHEALGECFAAIACKHNKPVGFAIWHSQPNDYPQRELLRAANEATYGNTVTKPRVYGEIKWILNELHGLRGKRNTAMHSPLVFVTDVMVDETTVMPQYFHGNPHAKELAGKDLLSEYRWYRKHLSILAQFAQCFHYAIIDPNYAWPDRPKLPPRGQFRNRGRSRRKTQTK